MRAFNLRLRCRRLCPSTGTAEPRMTPVSASWLALLQGRRAAYTWLLLLAVGVCAMGTHLLATVLPSVVADIGGIAFYAWASMLYSMAAIIGTACGGLVMAWLGPRRTYMGGGSVVLGGAVGCAVAPHIAVLLIACTLQGLGSGLLVAVAYSMVSELYAADLRSRVLSAISGVWSVAALLGPIIGGMFAGIGWWRGAFWSVVSLLTLLVSFAWYTLPSLERPRTAPSLPVVRLALLGAGVLSVASSGQVVALGMRLMLVGGACVLVGLTFHLDTRSPNRLFPSQPLALTTRVGTAAWMIVLFGMTAIQVTVFMPLTVQTLYGVSPLGAGYFTAVFSLSWTTMALCSAGLRDRWVHAAILLGPLAVLCGVWGLGVSVGFGDVLRLGMFLALTGAGIGVCSAHIGSWTIAAARPGEGALTAAALPTLQSLGFAFGAAIAGLVANTAGLARGMSRATVASAATWLYGLSIVGPVLILVCTLRFLWLHRDVFVVEPRSQGCL